MGGPRAGGGVTPRPLAPAAVARRPTIRDVARRAGVSLGTVSNALNRPDVVAPETLARVRAAIETSGFVRSSAARQLRAGTSRTIGVLILDVANPFFTDMVRGVESTLVEQGYMLVLCSTDDSVDKERRYLRMLEEHRVDGILATPVERDIASLTALRSRGLPVVLLDRRAPSRSLCSVTVDDARGGELAAGHLLALGHRKIAFVNGPGAIRQCADRLRGIRHALRLAGLEPKAALVEVGVRSLTAESGETAVGRLRAAAPDATAVICANDLLALGVLKGFARAGVRVPEDVSLVGYDDVAFSSMLSPPLTSIRQPTVALGATAAALLLEELSGGIHEHRQVVFEPELAARASTAAPGGG